MNGADIALGIFGGVLALIVDKIIRRRLQARRRARMLAAAQKARAETLAPALSNVVRFYPRPGVTIDPGSMVAVDADGYLVPASKPKGDPS